MAALLLVVAWNMANVPQIIQLIRRSGRNEIAVLLTCLILTVIFDMVIAITVGVLLASLLFIRTIAEMTKSIEIAHPEDLNDVLVYRISGPLFLLQQIIYLPIYMIKPSIPSMKLNILYCNAMRSRCSIREVFMR